MARKTNIARCVFTLKERTYITPHYIRLTLTSDEIEVFKNTTIGVNNKIFIAPASCDNVYLPEFDFEKGEWKPMDEAIKPIVRTYTHRGINLEKKELYIDFVAHGDEGPASNFALNAPVGSELGVAMGCDKSELYPEVDWYLLVGDATAIPVLSAILESLPSTATVDAIIEVEDERDIQVIQTKAKVNLEWLINATPGQNSQLKVRAKEIVVENQDQKSKFGYIAAEFSSVKALRNLLRKEKGWTKDELYAYSYWKFGKAESVSEVDRRAELNSDIA